MNRSLYNSDNILLTVIIPTWNRGSFLKTTLSKFCEQIQDGYEDNIEILIGDNCSSDNTKDVINKFKKKYHYVRAIYHKKNLGFTKNVLKLVELSKGHYIWFWGDDDLISSNTIKYILNKLLYYHPNVMLINTKNIISHDKYNSEYNVIVNNRLKISKDFFIDSYYSRYNILKKMNEWLYIANFLGAVIVNRKIFVNVLENIEIIRNFKNDYLFQAVIIKIIGLYGNLYIVGEPLLLHRKNEMNATGDIKRIIQINLYDVSEITCVIKKYLRYDYIWYKKKFLLFFLDTFLNLKKRGELNIKLLFDTIYRFYDIFPYILLFPLIYLIPSFIFKLWKKFLK